jgi:alpha-galactosidase
MCLRMLIRGLKALILCTALAMIATPAETLAPTPPMGWNSWDAYGLTINAEQFRANARVLAGLKSYGWNYAVVDEGWYFEDPQARPEARRSFWDANGRLIPDAARYPSAGNGAGFKPLADWTHAQGLRFGIHIVRGIPKGVVGDNLPVANSGFHAGEVADTSDTCPWDNGNYGVRDNPAGQAYYDSMMRLYASWGLDFLKVDCISDHPYKGAEIRMIAKAIRSAQRPIVLSLSPGPTNLSHAAEVGEFSEMWRISDDIWDGWEFKGHSFPNGILSAFDNLAKWAKFARPGNWPDADMLPWGSLTPHPGWGPPRQSHLTQDEERTQFTLWAVSRSPLILGANLTRLDEFTRSLITNREAIAIDQTAVSSAEIPGDPADTGRLRVWSAATGGPRPKHYLAVFNLQEAALERDLAWPPSLGGSAHAVFEIWSQRNVRSAAKLHVQLPPHGCALFRIEE